MKIACVAKLLKDNETAMLRERRAVDRKPFARPVTIECGKDQSEIHDAFSRDISPIGIGIISRVNFRERTRAYLTVHTIVRQEQTRVLAEVRWTKPFGKGWYLTGWHFLEEATT